MVLIRCLSRFYPNIPFKWNKRSIIKPIGESWSFQGVEASYINHPRKFAEKGKIPERSAKDLEGPIKLPGYSHPETTNEERYFTQKTKEQMEEIKRKIDKSSVDNPEKKD